MKCFRFAFLILPAILLMACPGRSFAEPVAGGLPLSALLAKTRALDGGTRAWATDRLGELGPGVPGVEAELIRLTESLETAEAAVEALATWGPVSTPRLRDLLQSGIAPARVAAARSLGALDSASPETVAALLTGLNDNHEEVRFEAAGSLSLLAPAQAIPAVRVLVQALDKTPPPERRYEIRRWGHFDMDLELSPEGKKTQRVLQALARIGPKARGAGLALRTFLEKPQEAALFTEGAVALAVVCADRPAEAEPFLEECLYRSSREQRVFAAVALTRLGRRDEPVILTLVHEVRFRPVDHPRWTSMPGTDPQIVEALVRVGPLAVPALVKALDAADVHHRAGAAQALARIKPLPESAYPALRKAMKDEDPSTQRWAALALADASPEARAIAIEALGDWGGSSWSGWDQVTKFPWHAAAMDRLTAEAIPELIDGLDHPNAPVRAGCAAHFGRLGVAARSAIPALRKRLGDGPDVACWAAIALGELGEEPVDQTALLLRAAANRMRKEPLVGLEASQKAQRAAAVLQRGGPATIRQLIAGLDLAEDANQRVHFLSELIRRHEDEVGALIAALDNKSPQVRATAAKALGFLGQLAGPALKPLHALLQDDDVVVRIQSATALWRLEGRAEDVLPTLTAGLKAKLPDHGDLAAEGLKLMGSAARPALPALVDWLVLCFEHISPRREASAVYAVAENAVAVLAESLRSENERTRIMASFYLAEIGPAAIPPLLALLSDPSPTVRRSAVEALLGLKEEGRSAVPSLRFALEDEDSSVAVPAARYLALYGGGLDDALAVFRRALNGPDPAVKALVARTMGELVMGMRPATPDLGLLLRDADSAVRLAAAQALGEVGKASPEDADRLAVALQDLNPNVRCVAARGLGRMSENGVMSPAATRALLGTLRDQELGVRLSALEGLSSGMFKDESLAGALIQALDDPEPKGSQSATAVLGTYGKPMLPHLIAALGHPSGQVRAGVAKVIADQGEDAAEAVQALAFALQDPDDNVREAAAAALAAIGAKAASAVPALVEAVRDANESVRCQAIVALQKTKSRSPSVVEVLVMSLADGHDQARRGAIVALGQFPTLPPGGRAGLASAVASSEGGDATKAAEALANLGRGGLAELKTLLQDDKPRVRYLAAIVCRRLEEGGDEIKPALRKALDDADADVRASAMESLVALGSPTPEDLIRFRQLASDEAATVRHAAMATLGTAKDRESFATVRTAVIRDPDADVRQAAADTLPHLRP